MEVGASQAEPIQIELLRKLTLRGLRGMEFVVSDAPRHLQRTGACLQEQSSVESSYIGMAPTWETPEASSVR